MESCANKFPLFSNQLVPPILTIDERLAQLTYFYSTGYIYVITHSGDWGNKTQNVTTETQRNTYSKPSSIGFLVIADDF